MAVATPAVPTPPAQAAPAYPAHEHGHELPYSEKLANNRLGLWLFFISEIFLFGGLLSVRFYLWEDTRPPTDQVIGLIVTVVLLISSVSMYMGESALERGNRRLFLILLPVTMLLGLVFLAGVMIFEWGLFPSIYQGHLTPWGDKYGAVVFAMTGMHAIHVISGLVFIGIVWNLGRKGHFSPSRSWGVESCAIYWHYVDLVWIFFYPAIYLIGHVVHH